MTRSEIIAATKLADAGSTTRLLQELEESGFIRKYVSFGNKSRNSLYQLVDFYTLFYLRFIDGIQVLDQNNWQAMSDTPAYRAWSGYVFEQVCLYHLPQIKNALGIGGIQTSTASWRSKNSENGAHKSVFLTLITTFGLKTNSYSGGLVHNEIEMDALFDA